MKKGEFTIVDAVHSKKDDLSVYKKLAEKYIIEICLKGSETSMNITDYMNILIMIVIHRFACQNGFEIIRIDYFESARDLERFTLSADTIRLMLNSPELTIDHTEMIPQFNNKKTWNILFSILEDDRNSSVRVSKWIRNHQDRLF